MMEPIREGRKAGWVVDRAEFDASLKTYYGMMGWDEHGIPSQAKLVELGLGNLAA